MTSLRARRIAAPGLLSIVAGYCGRILRFLPESNLFALRPSKSSALNRVRPGPDVDLPIRIEDIVGSFRTDIEPARGFARIPSHPHDSGSPSAFPPYDCEKIGIALSVLACGIVDVPRLQSDLRRDPSA